MLKEANILLDSNRKRRWKRKSTHDGVRKSGGRKKKNSWMKRGRKNRKGRNMGRRERKMRKTSGSMWRMTRR